MRGGLRADQGARSLTVRAPGRGNPLSLGDAERAAIGGRLAG